MVITSKSIFAAKLIHIVYYVLILFVVALFSETSFISRLIYGVVGLAFAFYGVKRFRILGLQDDDSTIPILLLSLTYILLGGYAFFSALNSSQLALSNLISEPVKIIVVGFFPLGLVTLGLTVFDIVTNK
jgi:prolipoprotein diacylglyceryltransferase